ncbi:MAG: hypothetical protein IT445_12850 [Phycisphaeraceae bacterium]|nr:hypothetical protein [Phycisphaeraceae bacterium]
MKTTLSLLTVVMLSIASQAFAGGSYTPPSSNCDIELPDCYWTVDFTVAYRWTSNSSYEYYNGTAFFDGSQVGNSGYDYLNLGSGLYGLEFDFKGKSFDQCDDDDVKLKFKDGDLVGLKFEFYTDGYKYRIDYSDFDKKIGGTWYKKGYVTYGDPSSTCQPIPTPAAAASGLSLLAALAFRRRRQAA